MAETSNIESATAEGLWKHPNMGTYNKVSTLNTFKESYQMWKNSPNIQFITEKMIH